MSKQQIQKGGALPELKWGDYIKAADFDVRVMDMQGSNGTFSGRGLAEMPWLK